MCPSRPAVRLSVSLPEPTTLLILPFSLSHVRAGSNDDLIETSRTYPFCTCILHFLPFSLSVNFFEQFLAFCCFFPFLMITNLLT